MVCLLMVCLSFMAVNEIKEHLFGFTHSYILTSALFSQK